MLPNSDVLADGSSGGDDLASIEADRSALGMHVLYPGDDAPTLGFS